MFGDYTSLVGAAVTNAFEVMFRMRYRAPHVRSPGTDAAHLTWDGSAPLLWAKKLVYRATQVGMGIPVRERCTSIVYECALFFLVFLVNVFV